ncbi:MAG: translocation/assembly module TamB, partial [Bacteroidales bacterium]|nr:translocation/assembly module TamB [Bacteroidales bacterium]
IDAETGIKVSLNEVENNMTINGQGLVEMELDPSRDVFNLNGNYDILSGDVHLLVLGLVGRNFTIKKGSSIIFGGDIKKSTLDVSANYRTKASLSNLIADSTAVGLRRNVDCSVHMTGRLTDPELSFAIDIPELDPSVKSMVESALSTEDKIQKQFVALLVGNSFLPDEQSGIENATSATLFSNVSGIMSNQLSNIFRKLNIPLDLGLKYQPGNYGNDMFDVAISTQLFNNRVIINGNLGNRRYESSQGSIAGDLEVEFKVNRSGSLRVNVFTRSTDSYTNYLDNLQRTGAGVSYQKEYDNFGKMVKYIFSSKPNRDALDEESRRAEISGERRILAQ